MSILDAIANPRMADIAGAMDIREARMERDKQRRDEIRMGQLVAQAVPGLREGTPLREMAETNPQLFFMVAKSLGIPTNAGDQMQAFADDAKMLYTLAQNDPREAYDYALQVKEQRNQQGLDTPQMDKFIAGMQEDPARTMTGLFIVHRNINGEEIRKAEMDERKLGLQESQLGLQEEQLAIQKQRMAQGLDVEDTKTAKQKEWEEYQRIKKQDPEAASQFGRGTGFETKEGQQLSSFAEKQIDGAFNEYTEASGNVNRYSTLAKSLRKANMSGGIKSTWTEYIKEQTGNQDEITALRKEARQIATSEGIKNLPPGPATDRDVEIVLSPFPTEKASPEYIANWLDAMSRLNQKRAEYAEFKADFISENGSVRNKQGQSLVAAWKESQGQGEPKDSGQKFTGQDQQAYEWAQANPNDPRSAAIMQRLGVK